MGAQLFASRKSEPSLSLRFGLAKVIVRDAASFEITVLDSLQMRHLLK